MPSIVALLGTLALAAPTITIRAAISEDLRAVRGTLETSELPDGNACAQATAKATATFAPTPALCCRRLMFGGPDGVRAIPDQLVQPNAQGILSLEIRPVLFDHAHVPLGVGTM